jgi:RNA polymerase sigma-70 factor (ECF subfamily)
VGDLIVQHSIRVWRSLKYLGVADQDLADASQEVFLVVHRRFEDFRGNSSFETWLYGICLGVSRNYVRRHRREARLRVDLPEEAPQEPSRHPSPDETLDLERARSLLRSALDRIPPEQREVFVLHEIEELGMGAIAETVGCRLFTAYSRLRLARKNLKRLLAESEGLK